MSKYPQEWINALANLRSDSDDSFGCFGLSSRISAEVLRRLEEIGALKDFPKPREWAMCKTHDYPMDSRITCCGHGGFMNQYGMCEHIGEKCEKVIAREVLEEEGK